MGIGRIADTEVRQEKGDRLLGQPTGLGEPLLARFDKEIA